MSTEHQQYSIDNQHAMIRAYAAAHGMSIVKTYADRGKSGLALAGRSSLLRLLDDIDKGEVSFEKLLVYDVSRWGRFQNPDEAAAHEQLCRSRGIEIIYCAEQFSNDGSISSSILKSVKRIMAAEYSRELSDKVFHGQKRLIRSGFRQGGYAGFGLRRLLVDQHGNHKCILKVGEHKSILTDRIILIPGPQYEIALVQKIYDLYIKEEQTEQQIADYLNSYAILSDLKRPWQRWSIRQILSNEKYIGNNVWGKKSNKLRKGYRRKSADQWVRANGVFEAIVDPDIFAAAQKIMIERFASKSDDEYLEVLSELLKKHGYLSKTLIDEDPDCPTALMCIVFLRYETHMLV
jgi:DNA invertase Pin-like site-specific DNA recombinase